MLVSLISLWPLVVFISHAVIPVRRRLPFRAAVFLLYTIFVEALFRAAIPWLLNSEFAQNFISDIALGLGQGRSGQQGDGLHLIDEL